jgi:hypothetical protein
MLIAEAKYKMCTSLMASTCPLLFFTFFSFLRKYLHAPKNSTLENGNPRRTNISRLTKIFTKRSEDDLPELALGSDLVGGPQLHAVDLGMLIAGRRQRTTHHLVLMELHKREQREINRRSGSKSNRIHGTKGAEVPHPEGHHFRKLVDTLTLPKQRRRGKEAAGEGGAGRR